MPMLSIVVAAITAGLVALELFWPRVRSGTSGARLAVELSIAILALTALLVGLLMGAQHLPW